MWRVIGTRCIPKVGIIQNRTITFSCVRKSRHDILSTYFKTQLQEKSDAFSGSLKLTLTNKPLLKRKIPNNLNIPKSYTVSSSLFAKNNVAADKKEAKNEKCDILEKIKEDLFKDDPELKTTIVEMYEDFDDRVAPTGEDEKKTDFESKVKQASDAIPYSLQQRFQVYRDSDAETILDEVDQMNLQLETTPDEEDEVPFSIYQQKKDPLAGLTVKRGVEGVFDIGELVDILRKENAQEICVIAVPPELHYTDYMVIVSAISRRHVRAMGEFLRKLYKLKKGKQDKFVIIEGESCMDWQVLDMGNIVLHVFMPETRLRYDLETLWSVGHQFDDLTQRPPVDSVFEALQSHLQFLEDMKPANQDLSNSHSSNKTLSQQ